MIRGANGGEGRRTSRRQKIHFRAYDMPGRGRLLTEPLYQQVRRLLAERIAGGIWPPGAMLPNELDLARELGVSPGTVRKALDSLKKDRLLVRRQGRGTFVADQASKELAVRFGNIRNGGGQRIIGDLELLSQAQVSATAIERERLQLQSGATVVRTTRLRRCEGRLFMYEEACLAVGRFPGLDAESLGNYGISALAQRHGIHLSHAREQVAVVQASPEVAHYLDVEPQTPLLKLDRVISAADGQPVEWRVGLCHLRKNIMYVSEMN